MVAYIEFIRGLKEESYPIVKLTRSKKGENGTATFIFNNPLLFSSHIYFPSSINGMYLVWDNNLLETNDIKIFFKNGKPFLIKSILILKNSEEWFKFLSFINTYSKQNGLTFKI
jgi:photosystem II protein